MTQIAKHTPGPWHYKHDDYAKSVINIEAEGFIPIARMTGTAAARNDSEANARLIAAAPELLAALKLAKYWLDDITAKGGHIAADTMNARHTIEAAIAKAEGR